MNKEEIKKIGEYLNLKYVIARDVNSNDKLETQDKYIQQLYDVYLDLRIKYNDLQSQLDIANNKLKEANKYCMEVAKYENEILNEFPSNEFQPEYQINISRLNLVKCILSIIGGNDE